MIQRKRNKQRESPRRTLPERHDIPGAIGVTVITPGYEPLLGDAIGRFRQNTGLDVLVLRTREGCGFSAKLSFDQLIAPRPIVFFDVDIWFLRPFDFAPLATSGQWCAVHDPGVFNPGAFPCSDCEREGWDKSQYFNSGLFVCDLGNPEHRAVFAEARAHLEECRAGRAAKPVDWTDQYFLNWAVRRRPGLFRALPFALNFYKLAVDWGSYPAIPRNIIALHAAGALGVEAKLAKLQREAAVFGEPARDMLKDARDYYTTHAR